ncbi:MAG: 4Fe-4S dicluster domain-containing protein [Ignavibacteriaceae bacterium]|nr:4Fe-4S dicluster domain-containing protein [Ignavibacteriaceae bacterium]
METLQNIAQGLLERGDVSMVIGYTPGTIPGKTKTIFARTPEAAQKLTFNENCVNNLSIYLTRQYGNIGEKPVALVVKACDARTVNVLIQENQLKREQVYLIAVPCNGVKDEHGVEQGKCKSCAQRVPKDYDALAGETPAPVEIDPTLRFKALEQFDAMSPDERWEFWMKEFEKCVKCYACRQACPLCYCERCITDKTTPRWIEPDTSTAANLSWHITRAFHLAGRCIGCGECERACHQNIPLGLLNRKMAKEVFDNFGYRAGESAEAKPVFADFRYDDKEEFIR